MKIVIVGLGKMGMQIVTRLLEDGHQVVVLDPNQQAMQEAVQKGAIAAEDREHAAVEQFDDQPPLVWLMVPASVVEEELNSWLDILPANSIIVDGGNSDFRETKKRAEKALEKNVHLVDVGTSGGILGTKNGFSMMAGGNDAAVKAVEPVLESLARPHGGYFYFGEAGAGHFVKMVHNAIEYGVMESLAEGYRLLHDGPYENLDLAAAGNVWQQESIIKSSLNELAAKGLAENPELEGVDGYVAESGEARWALDAANDKDIDMPAIQAALDVRVKSEDGNINFATKLLAELRNEFGGHALNKQ
jgi:6-phosphogluconate dehydrogenase